MVTYYPVRHYRLPGDPFSLLASSVAKANSMSKSSKKKNPLSASQKKSEQLIRDKEKAAQERAEKTANLRALRLAKEAEDNK